VTHEGMSGRRVRESTVHSSSNAIHITWAAHMGAVSMLYVAAHLRDHVNIISGSSLILRTISVLYWQLI